MRVLVTGVNGFVGRHLATELDLHGHKAIAFEHPDAGHIDHTDEAYYGDICDIDSLRHAIKESKPDACVHLAAIAFVPDGASDPARMMSVNVNGTQNLLEAIREFSPACKTLVVSSAHVYGQSRGDKSVHEEDDLAPSSVYAESKAKADLASLAYASEHNMHIMTARPHNHIGPGQSNKFVISSFIQQAKAIAAKQQDPIINVGNLESQRDFTDVRDVVRAYRLLLENGTKAKAYNIASESMHKIGDLLEVIIKLANIQPEIVVNDSLYRPTDSSALLDTSRISNDTGWKTEISLNETLNDILQSVSI